MTQTLDLDLLHQANGAGVIGIFFKEGEPVWGGTCGAEPCADGFVAKLDPGQSGSASLLYSSYLGGGSQDEILAIAVDGAGLTYLTGYAQSSNFPTLNPLQASRAGSQDVVLVKLDLSAVGTASLLYATYLGGSSTDRGQGIGLDAQGKVYLTGFTQSANFPTANALQPALGGGRDAMAVKIDLASNSLVYATYLGGGGEDQAGAIAVDGAGNAYLTGFVESVDFPVANAIQASKGGKRAAHPLPGRLCRQARPERQPALFDLPGWGPG